MTDVGSTNSRKVLRIKSILTPTPGSTVTLVIVDGEDHVAIWTAAQIESVVISGTHSAGQELTCIITNDATLGRVITFSTGFLPVGIVTGTISKSAVVKFVSNGTNFLEISRSLVL